MMTWIRPCGCTVLVGLWTNFFTLIDRFDPDRPNFEPCWNCIFEGRNR